MNGFNFQVELAQQSQLIIISSLELDLFLSETYSPRGDGLTKSRRATFLPILAAETSHIATVILRFKKSVY